MAALFLIDFAPLDYMDNEWTSSHERKNNQKKAAECEQTGRQGSHPESRI